MQKIPTELSGRAINFGQVAARISPDQQLPWMTAFSISSRSPAMGEWPEMAVSRRSVDEIHP